jgi:hypothetical protein
MRVGLWVGMARHRPLRGRHAALWAGWYGRVDGAIWRPQIGGRINSNYPPRQYPSPLPVEKPPRPVSSRQPPYSNSHLQAPKLQPGEF